MNIEYSRQDTVKEYFSTRSEYWNNLYNPSGSEDLFTRFELSKRKDIVFSLISEIPADHLSSALDLGCGAGHYLAQLAMMNLDCTGVDISDEMLDLTRDKLVSQSTPGVKLVQSNCNNIPIQDQSFDLILCVGLLEYLDNEDDTLREIKRLLTPGGFAIVTFPNLIKLRNLLNPYYYLVRLWTYFFERQHAPSGPENPSEENATYQYGKSTVTRYRLGQVRKLLKRSSFKIIAEQPCCYGPFALWKESRCSTETSAKTSDFLENIQKHKGLGFLHHFANRWVILIQPETDQ